jgi:hypothetical protein
MEFIFGLIVGGIVGFFIGEAFECKKASSSNLTVSNSTVSNASVSNSTVSNANVSGLLESTFSDVTGRKY